MLRFKGPNRADIYVILNIFCGTALSHRYLPVGLDLTTLEGASTIWTGIWIGGLDARAPPPPPPPSPPPPLSPPPPGERGAVSRSLLRKPLSDP